MRSGIVISGLLHAVLLFFMLTQPLNFYREHQEQPQPLVEFTYFDTTTVIEVDVDEPIEEDETASTEVEEAAADSLAEAEEETALAEETPPEETAKEVAQEEQPEEVEPEALAESESELEAVDEIAEEPAEETELPETAESSAPLELPELSVEPDALADIPTEDAPVPGLEAAESAAPAAAVPESALAETAAVVPALPQAAPLQPQLPDSPASTAEPLIETAPEETPEPLIAEDPVEALELAGPALPEPEQLPQRRPQSIEEQPEQNEPGILSEQTALGSPLPRDLAEQYRPQWQGRVRGNQLLDNLALVRDEDAQARANPALWEVVRLLRQQVKECWQLGRPGLDHPDYFVEMEVRLERSGSLNHAHILDVAKMVDNESFAAFARNAKSALERCAPYDLPADRYSLWGDLVVRFLARGQGLAGR